MRITIDIRIPTNLSCNKVLELIDIRINEIKDLIKGVKIKYRVEDKTEPFQANVSSPLLRGISIIHLGSKKKKTVIVKENWNG